MEPAAKQIGSKATRYLIGASILLLALMLFSEFSCSLLGLCTNWFPLAEILGFWEVLGISTALLFAAFSIRALTRNHEPRLKSRSDYQSFVSTSSFDREKSADHQDAQPSPPTSAKRNPGWRDLFNQLSDEEKEKLKTIMEKHCIPPPEQASHRESDASQTLRN